MADEDEYTHMTAEELRESCRNKDWQLARSGEKIELLELIAVTGCTGLAMVGQGWSVMSNIVLDQVFRRFLPQINLQHVMDPLF